MSTPSESSPNKSTSQESSTDSPLTTDQPDTISSLFLRPIVGGKVPWSEADLERMIEELRKQRATLGPDQKPKAKTAAKLEMEEKVAAAKTGADVLELLGLEVKPLGKV